MSREKFRRNVLDLRTGIEACMAQRVQLPALVLIYSAIDVAGWLSNDDPTAKVGTRFMAWVDLYLLKAKPLHCTSADLYAARCGLLHTLTSESDMSDQGKARQICYAWGNRDADALQALTVRFGLDDQFVCVGVEQLYEAWNGGVDLLVKEMECNPVREGGIVARAAKFFNADATPALDRLIEGTR
jgi:hypothetical protein